MEKTGQVKPEAAKEQPGKDVKAADVQTTTGLTGLNVSALIEIVQNSKARHSTRIEALGEIHGRSGCQYTGLERLDIDILAKVVVDKTIPEDLRAAAADALALRRPADKTSTPHESD
ncbi:hypothetical protein LCGC14_2511930, partial [marine sediment metagenome]